MSREQLDWVGWLATASLGTESRFRVIAHHPDAAYRLAWDSEVQPEIDRVGLAAWQQREWFRRPGFFQPVPVDDAPAREDTGWRWSDTLPPGEVCRADLLAEAAGLQPNFFALSIVHPVSQRLIPAALLLVCDALDPAPAVLGGPCAFVGHLSVAPESTLVRLLGGFWSSTQLRRLALDLAISHSFHLGRRGRLLLHAPALGGSRLLRLYLELGLTPVPDSVPEVSDGLPNDGRYFIADEAGALRLSVGLDLFRKPFVAPAATAGPGPRPPRFPGGATGRRRAPFEEPPNGDDGAEEPDGDAD